MRVNNGANVDYEAIFTKKTKNKLQTHTLSFLIRFPQNNSRAYLCNFVSIRT